jgi:UDP-glucose 4-epimerase
MSNKQILILGGAGYIGSHTLNLLKRSNYDVIVIDNLYSGHEKALGDLKDRFIKGDISSKTLLQAKKNFGKIDGIIHFAGYIEVGESMRSPYKYIKNNIDTATLILEFMKDEGVKNIVFSSSAAVYGKDYSEKIKEDFSKNPINVYGFTKSAFEDILNFYSQIYGINYVSLRYFNASGASHFTNIGEDHPNETHLIPLILKTVQGKRDHVDIYGDDYKTKDGTCIRDYIHVDDLASAHLLSMEHIINGGESNIFNLGGSKGYSVKEIIDTTEKITGMKVNFKISKRREGDPDILIADYSKIKNILGWQPKFGIDDIIETAWKWHKNNPEGFNI